jgi:stage II sporulation protein D
VSVKVAGRGVVQTDLEEYVAWVLAGEAGGFTQDASLEAMAVAARTYARFFRGRHAGQGYDFCETTHCMDARPAAVTERLRRAVAATEGQLLWYKGRLAQVYFDKHCGGKTAAASEYWAGTGRPYLPVQDDSFCLSAGRLPWSAKAPLSELSAALGLPGLRSVEVLRRTASGRVAMLETDRGPVAANRLSWSLVRSRLFDVHVEGDTAVFAGYGEGHGIGLCQTGAEERAKAGHDARRIFAFYYPGTRVGITAQDIAWQRMAGERVDLFSPAPDAATLAVADRAVREAEKRSGLKLPARVTLRTFPTARDFRDATAEPGFVAASTRGLVVRMQSPQRLRSEGVLDSTLLHEMLHVALNAYAAPGAQAWLLEGLALFLEKGAVPPAKVLPSTSARLLRPGSEAAYRAARENARAAVSGLVREKGLRAVLAGLQTNTT